MVRLHAAGGDERVGALGLRASGDERELADLVSAEPERNRVVALDEEARAAADERGQPRHRFDRGRLRRERDRRNARERVAQRGWGHGPHCILFRLVAKLASNRRE